MVRYVHLPGSAVDTALLEDGKSLAGLVMVVGSNSGNSNTEGSTATSGESEIGWLALVGWLLAISCTGQNC